MEKQTSNKAGKILMFLASAILLIGIASALSINVDQGELYPGQSSDVDVNIKNILSDDITDVSFNLIFSNTRFISVGGSEESIDEIKDGDTESVTFKLKASQDAKPGDYTIPYTLVYTIDDGNDTIIKEQGTIGVTIGAKTELDYSVESNNPVVGNKGKITVKVINRGFGDIKFATIKIAPQGLEVLGNDRTYIGTISSDDFESTNFDVIFKDTNSNVMVTLYYKDFDNNEQTETVTLPVKVYSKEEALELGIIQKNNTALYVGIVVLVIVAWFVYRAIRKRKKKKEA